MRILKIKTPTELTTSVEKDIQDGVNMVGVFAEWCHNCRDMQPEWESFTNSMRNEKLNGKIITIYEPAFKQSKCKTCFSGIMGYPTIMILKNGIPSGEFKNMPREAQYFRQYAKDNIPELKTKNFRREQVETKIIAKKIKRVHKKKENKKAKKKVKKEIERIKKERNKKKKKKRRTQKKKGGMRKMRKSYRMRKTRKKKKN
tara:strand:- start:827 stop:1429 length:603 start_codon:yes stop_codon:yes gene_type:complete